MSVMDEAERLVAAGRQRDAVALIERAAGEGDAEALFALANWRLFGLFGPRDVHAAMALFERAAASGDVEAVRSLAILIGNGTAGPPDPERAMALMATISARDPASAAQLDLLSRMPTTQVFADDAAELLSERPYVRLHRALQSPAECAYLMRCAEPMLRPSFVVNPATGGRMADPIRTSWSMSLGLTLEDLVVHRINARVAAASGTAVACGEPLHILRYQDAQEYRPHTDSMAGESNQRAWTVLIYLNDGYDGGETHFPRARLKIRGEVGDALIFRNVDTDGHIDLVSLHAGLPVTRGVKWLATRWIRTQPMALT